MVVLPGTLFTGDTAPAITATNDLDDEFSGTFTADGGFSIAVLPDGTYTVQFSDPSLFGAGVTNVVVTAGQVVVLPAITVAAGGTIQGTVLDQATGQPLVGVSVNIQDPNNPVVATTDANGMYTATDVPPGTQVAVANLAGFLPETLGGLVVTANQTTTAPDLTLAPAASVSGTVTVQGTPIAGATIELIESSTVSDQVLTDSSGFYQFTNLLAASYTLAATAPPTLFFPLRSPWVPGRI